MKRGSNIERTSSEYRDPGFKNQPCLFYWNLNTLVINYINCFKVSYYLSKRCQIKILQENNNKI